MPPLMPAANHSTGIERQIAISYSMERDKCTLSIDTPQSPLRLRSVRGETLTDTTKLQALSLWPREADNIQPSSGKQANLHFKVPLSACSRLLRTFCTHFRALLVHYEIWNINITQQILFPETLAYYMIF